MGLSAPCIPFLLGMLGTANSQATAACPVGVDARVVSTTAEASELSEALLCTGAGQFEVEWEGKVLLERPIAISDSSFVKITGAPGEAMVDGGGALRLFHISGNSTLELHGLSLVNGSVVGADLNSVDDISPDLVGNYSGAAVYVLDEDSRLSASNCSFIGNNASYFGGETRYPSILYWKVLLRRRFVSWWCSCAS